MAFNTSTPNGFPPRPEDNTTLIADILSHFVAGIVMLDTDGTVVSWDAQAERMTGYSLQEIRDVGFVQLCSPADIMQQLIVKAHHGGPTWHEYIKLRRHDHSHIAVIVQCTLLSAGGSHAPRIVVAFWELSPLQDCLGQYEHIQTLGRLASSLSHEIRNPLNTIFLSVGILEEELQQLTANNLPLMTETLQDIKEEISRIDELVQDYLSLSRLTNLHREPADLGAMLEEIIQEVQEQLRERRLSCAIQGLDSLRRVICHRGALRRALRNLIQNAIDAMAPGGTLTLCGWQEGAWMSLRIHDTGSGFSEDQLPWVFMPFHTTKPEGTGMGLYVVHEIITAHGGTITVTSSLGQGTAMTIRLPLMHLEEMSSG